MDEDDDIIEVSGPTTTCDGGGGALGHPRVFLRLDGDGRAECPYCGQLFVRAPGAERAVAH